MATPEDSKNESNVIPLLPTEVREPLEKFTHTLCLSDFLDALKAIAPLKVPIDPLVRIWEEHLYEFAKNLPKRGTRIVVSQNMEDEREQFKINIAPFTTFISWLAQFELDPEQRKKEAGSDVNEDSLHENIRDEFDDLEGADDLSAEDVPHMSEADKLRDHFKDKYPCFPAAWPLENLLPEYFGDDDPATFIAQFMATFYQVHEREAGCPIGGKWDDDAGYSLKSRLITIHNPGWRKFVEKNLIEDLITLEAMHWINAANITEMCKTSPDRINEGVNLIRENAKLADELYEEGTAKGAIGAGMLLVKTLALTRIIWMDEVIAARKAAENKETCKEEIDTTEDDEVEATEDDKETVECKRNMARIQGLADALPLIKGIVFEGLKGGHSPGPFSDEFEFYDVPSLLPFLPQTMFDRVVYWANQSCIDFTSNDEQDHIPEQRYDFWYGGVDQFFYTGSASFLDVILSWPMVGEALSWDDFNHPALSGKIWGEKIQDVVPFDMVPHMTIYHLERFFLSWVHYNNYPYHNTNLIVTAARQANGNDFATPGYSIQRLSYLIESTIKRISHARRTAYAGLSPFSINSAAYLGETLSTICLLLRITPKHDLSYLLATNSDLDDKGFGRSPFAARAYQQDTPEEMQSYAQDRAASYMRVFHAAVEEGWDEFANAVLAFFLFSQPIHFENRLWVDWRDLGAALRLASTLNGYHRVERALGVAGAMICGDGQRHYDALCLAAWVPEDAPSVELPAADFTGVTVAKRTIIEQELVDYLGAETWLKLGPEAKRQLVEADIKWDLQHSKFGRGIRNWGGLATEYVNVIEGELGRRLADVLNSDVFRNDHTRAKGRPPEPHITLGPMLYIFKDFELRDQALKDLITATNIHLQDDVTLINHLLKVMHYRNRSAHPVGLSADEFSKLRTLLFEKGVLKRFIELL